MGCGHGVASEKILENRNPENYSRSDKTRRRVKTSSPSDAPCRFFRRESKLIF
jgi:hypothetical protein